MARIHIWRRPQTCWCVTVSYAFTATRYFETFKNASEYAASAYFAWNPKPNGLAIYDVSCGERIKPDEAAHPCGCSNKNCCREHMLD